MLKLFLTIYFINNNNTNLIFKMLRIYLLRRIDPKEVDFRPNQRLRLDHRTTLLDYLNIFKKMKLNKVLSYVLS